MAVLMFELDYTNIFHPYFHFPTIEEPPRAEQKEQAFGSSLQLLVTLQVEMSVESNLIGG